MRSSCTSRSRSRSSTRVRRCTSRLKALGANVLYIPPGEKARYHAAAVFASNFPTVLMCLAEELLREMRLMQAWLGLERLEIVPAGDLGPALAAFAP